MVQTIQKLIARYVHVKSSRSSVLSFFFFFFFLSATITARIYELPDQMMLKRFREKNNPCVSPFKNARK